ANTAMPLIRAAATGPEPPSLPITVVRKAPDPGVLSCRTRRDPRKVPILMLVAVPWPAATIEPALDVTDMPEMEPAETEPVLPLLPMTTSERVPEPGLVSSWAVMEPLLVPMEMSVIVPWPAATMEPALDVTDMAEMEAAETDP